MGVLVVIIVTTAVMASTPYVHFLKGTLLLVVFSLVPVALFT